MLIGLKQNVTPHALPPVLRLVPQLSLVEYSHFNLTLFWL